MFSTRQIGKTLVNRTQGTSEFGFKQFYAHVLELFVLPITNTAYLILNIFINQTFIYLKNK